MSNRRKARRTLPGAVVASRLAAQAGTAGRIADRASTAADAVAAYAALVPEAGRLLAIPAGTSPAEAAGRLRRARTVLREITRHVDRAITALEAASRAGLTMPAVPDSEQPVPDGSAE